MIEPSADLGWVIFERLRRLAGLGFVAFAADRWLAALRNLREGKLKLRKADCRRSVPASLRRVSRGSCEPRQSVPSPQADTAELAASRS
jgi:hypothetical protein